MAVVLAVFGKIIHVLLIILAILLLLVLFLLFCPLHYKCELEKSESLAAKGAVRWLIFLVYLPFSYENGKFELSVRIFGIRFRRRKKKRPEREKKQRKKREQTENTGQQAEVELVSMEIPEGEKEGPSDAVLEKTENRKKSEKPENRMISEGLEGQTGKKNGKRREQKKKRGGFRGFSSVKSIFGRIKEKSSWTKDVKSFLKEENTKQTICIIKENVVHLLKKLKPKVFKGSVEFGTGDPCRTGQVLGLLACLYAYYGGGIEIIPDFMEKKLLGHLYVRGSITLFTILFLLFRVILSKGWKEFIKEAKELKEAI